MLYVSFNIESIYLIFQFIFSLFHFVDPTFCIIYMGLLWAFLSHAFSTAQTHLSLKKPDDETYIELLACQELIVSYIFTPSWGFNTLSDSVIYSIRKRKNKGWSIQMKEN